MNIVCAFINAFKKITNINIEKNRGGQYKYSSIVIKKIKHNSDQNVLTKIRTNHIEKTTVQKWFIFQLSLKKMSKISVLMASASSYYFDRVISFAIGNYQIKQAKDYIFEHLKPSMPFEEQHKFVVQL